MTIQCEDILFLSFLSIYGGSFIVTWNSYSSCYTPIQLAIFMFCIGCIFIRIMIILQRTRNLAQRVKTFKTVFFNFIVIPFNVIVAIVFTIFQILNQRHSPFCLPWYIPTTAIWLILIVANIQGLIFLLTGIIKLKQAYDRNSYRNRMRRWARETNDPNLREQLLDVAREPINPVTGRTGLDPALIKALPVKRYKTENRDLAPDIVQNTCPICLTEFEIGQDLTMVPPCDHLYHPVCISAWLIRDPFCPMCRTHVGRNMRVDVARNNQDRAVEGREYMRIVDEDIERG